MARINLSIPDELKEQMDTFPDENWSRVAQEAFATHLLITQLKGTDMQAAGIERLRASKRTNSEREHAEGVELGKEWALNYAEYQDLEAVAKLGESIGGEWCAPGAAFHVLEAIGADGNSYEDTVNMFETDEPSDELIEGFIQGAAEIFAHV